MTTFKNFLLENHLADSAKLGAEYPWVKGVQISSNEGSHLPLKRDYIKIGNVSVPCYRDVVFKKRIITPGGEK